jgi:hypothetical protein
VQYQALSQFALTSLSLSLGLRQILSGYLAVGSGIAITGAAIQQDTFDICERRDQLASAPSTGQCVEQIVVPLPEMVRQTMQALRFAEIRARLVLLQGVPQPVDTIMHFGQQRCRLT